MLVMGGCGTPNAPTSLAFPGLGCPDCHGTCGGMTGLTMDGSGLFGTGIFGTGVSVTDLSTWTWAEYGTLALGAYTLLSLVHTTKAGAQRVGTRARKIKKAVTS
jgi:hypothetical protein